MKRTNLTTLLLHTPFPKKDVHGSLNFPVYDNVAFEADTAEYSPEQKASMGLRDTMIRLSVGIEDIDDLIEDLNQAFLS